MQKITKKDSSNIKKRRNYKQRGYLFDVVTYRVFKNDNTNIQFQNDCVIINNWENIKERYNLETIVKIAKKVASKYQKVLVLSNTDTATEVSKKLWDIFGEINKDAKHRIKQENISEKSGNNGTELHNAARIPRKRGNPVGRRRRQRNYKFFKEEIIKFLCADGGSGIPPQAREIIRFFNNFNKDVFTELEIKAEMDNLKPLLKTRQDPFRIFSYYEDKLERYGLLKREYF